jgi:hypothetical protein
MGTFMKISSAPHAIRDSLESLTQPEAQDQVSSAAENGNVLSSSRDGSSDG